MSKRLRSTLALCALVSVGAMVTAASASAATFLGTNGDILFGHNTSSTDSDIFKLTTNGQLIQLTNDPGSENAPSWSGTGEFFAFGSFPAGPGPAFNSLETMRYDGTGRKVILQGTSTLEPFDPTVSKDGKVIVFSAYDDASSAQQLFKVNADGTGLVQLTSATESSFDPEISPDGTQVAFDRFNSTSGFEQLMTVSINGGNAQTLFSPGSNVSSPAWAPNGQFLVYEQYIAVPGQYDIGRVDANGLNPSLLTNTATEDEASPKVSPDGTKLAYDRAPTSSSNPSNIYQSDISGANATPLTNEGTGNFNYLPDYQALNPPSDCELTGKTKVKSTNSIPVTVNCPTENVSVSISGQGSAPVPKGAVASKKKKFNIPATTATVPENTPTTVSVKIPKKGKKALKKAAKAGKKGKATLTATFTDDLDQTATATFKVTFPKKKKKK